MKRRGIAGQAVSGIVFTVFVLSTFGMLVTAFPQWFSVPLEARPLRNQLPSWLFLLLICLLVAEWPKKLTFRRSRPTVLQPESDGGAPTAKREEASCESGVIVQKSDEAESR